MASSARYYTDTYLGQVFIGSTAVAGVKPPAYNATAHTFCVWNPLGSGKNIVPIKLLAGWSDTTGAAGNLVLSYQTGVGSQVATGSPITAATLVAPVNANVGTSTASIAKFAPATITFASATSLLYSTGISQLVTTSTTAVIGTFTAQHDFEGLVIIPPGVALCIAGNIALLSNFDLVLLWEEV